MNEKGGEREEEEKKKNTYMLLVKVPEGTRPLKKLRLRWVDNIKIDLGEIRWGAVINWIGLTHYRDMWRALVNGIMNLRVP
jgi:hypothetical protein